MRPGSLSLQQIRCRPGRRSSHLLQVGKHWKVACCCSNYCAHWFLAHSPQTHLLDTAQAAWPPARSLWSIMKTIRTPIFSFLCSCSIYDRITELLRLEETLKIIPQRHAVLSLFGMKYFTKNWPLQQRIKLLTFFQGPTCVYNTSGTE